MKSFVCFSHSLASFLISEGFSLISVRPDNKEPRRKVYIFANSIELLDAVDRHKNLFVRVNVGQKQRQVCSIG